MDEIHEMAVKGQSIIAAMGTQMPMPGWDDILFLGAQLNPMPLDEHAPVKTETIIGKHAAKPMVLDHPVYISHMSFGALSRETKTALSRGSAMARTAMCSGEGGILPEEKAAAYKYIFEYVPNQYSVTDENLREADAIEIKIGQGTKPGMGGHLPGGKVTPEIAAIRNKPLGQDVISPSRFPGIDTKEDLKALVDKMELTAVDPADQTVFISHGDCLEDAEMVAQMVRDRFGVQTIYINYVGPVIGAHTGPGVVALFYVGSER